MTRTELLAFMRSERFAVQASVARHHNVQAAVVGIAVSQDFEIIFDTLSDSRKATNLRANPSVAFVIGSTRDGTERTVQYEGVATCRPRRAAPGSGDLLRGVSRCRDRLH
jgi:general stress protein 26